MLTCENYKMFRGTMRITPVTGTPPFDVTGEWLYKPDCGCWYCNGRSYASEVCAVVDDVDRWIPMIERMPKNGYALAYCCGGNRTSTFFWNGESKDLDNLGYVVTHWRPLPEPPEKATP